MEPSSFGPETNPRFEKIDKGLLLSRCPLFSGLSQWELKSISRLMRLVEYRKDEVVYKEGGPPVGLYVVVSGRFEAYVWTGDKKKVLAYLHRGDHFGEMSLLTHEPHSATLRALSDSLVLELKKDDFETTVAHNPTVSLELSRRLSLRLKVHESRSRSLFKSDVLAIFGNESHSGRASFSLNLAASLFHETHQKTILVELSHASAETSPLLRGVQRISAGRFQNVENDPAGTLSKLLTRHPAGFEVLSVIHEDAVTRSVLIPLLNHLSIEYRFILIDLPDGVDETVVKALSQSDTVFFVTDNQLNNITEIRETIADLEKTLSLPEERVSVVIHEALFGVRTTQAVRREFFGKKRCFSLSAAPGERAESATPLVIEEPDAEYSRTVRHIARYVSNNLVGLALGSGAAFGLAHIGVLKVLEREKIPIDVIAGSSIGALIGSIYAVGRSVQEIEDGARQITRRVLFGKLMDINLFPIRGLLHGNEVIKHFSKQLKDRTFEDCRIPLRITGANLSSKQVHVFETGIITDAVRASIAIPAIFKPILIGRDWIVDGGILSPLPVRVLHEAGANKVIAVNVFPTAKDVLERRIRMEDAVEKEEKRIRRQGILARALLKTRKFFSDRFFPNTFDILMNTIQAMEAEMAEGEAESADVLLRPVLPDANWVQFYNPGPFIKRGEEETVKLLPKIKSLVSQQNV